MLVPHLPTSQSPTVPTPRLHAQTAGISIRRDDPHWHFETNCLSCLGAYATRTYLRLSPSYTLRISVHSSHSIRCVYIKSCTLVVHHCATTPLDNYTDSRAESKNMPSVPRLSSRSTCTTIAVGSWQLAVGCWLLLICDVTSEGRSSEMEPRARFDYDVNIYRSLTSVDKSKSQWLEFPGFLDRPETTRIVSRLQISR